MNERTLNRRHSDITGIILAGGRSRRMGRDKAQLALSGSTLFERVLETMTGLFEQVIIAGERPDLARKDVPFVPDIYPGSALGGLHTGLSAITTDWMCVVPCDLPFPDTRILETLISHRGGVDAVVPKTAAGYEPVIALYHRRCLSAMESMLQSGQHRILDLFDKIELHTLDSDHFPPGSEKAFLNINTPEDFDRVQRIDR